jgi:hypothetical protein
VDADWAELVKITSRVIDNASRRRARRDLDNKNSFESKGQVSVKYDQRVPREKTSENRRNKIRRRAQGVAC